MSRGTWSATIHRVVDIGRDRLSMPYFYEPHCDANINCSLPPNLLGHLKDEDDARHVPFVSFLLKKLQIYSEYESLNKTLPQWMVDKYLTRSSVPDCWATTHNEPVD